MRHAKKRLQLNRSASFRRATLISLAKGVLIYQSIKTTKQKAHAAKPLIEKLISLGKNNSLAAKRQAYKILGEHRLVSLLFGNIAPRFVNRTGGYTRTLLSEARRGDNAQLAVLELTELKKKEPVKPEKKEKGAEIQEAKPQIAKEKPRPFEEKKPIIKKPVKKFLGGLRNIFKKERDSL